MAITSGNPDNFQLFYVTHKWCDNSGTWTTLMSLKELQSAVKSWNNIIKIERAIIIKGDEVDIEEIKPKKYKGKPYTYKEKYGDK